MKKIMAGFLALGLSLTTVAALGCCRNYNSTNTARNNYQGCYNADGTWYCDNGRHDGYCNESIEQHNEYHHNGNICNNRRHTGYYNQK